MYLRPPTPADADELIERNRASTRLHRGWVDPPKTPEAFAAYLLRCYGDDGDGLLVCRAEDHAIAGVFNVTNIVRGAFQSALLGYYACVPFAGTGAMRAALPLVLDHVFGPLGLHRIEANIQPANAPSIALVEGAGFTREGYSRRYLKIAGRWRDHERWAMLAEDWQILRRRGPFPKKESTAETRRARRGE